MITVIGVRFRTAGKIYYFSPGELEVASGDHVIVQTIRGVEYGQVVVAPRDLPDEEVPQPLRSIIRLATEEDNAKAAEIRVKEKEAFYLCKERIRKHELEMKLIDVEYTFDTSKIMFYFTADGRVDFRDLVKDLAGIFRTRIELRQVGVRDETKIMGGIGICGRALCCHSYLADFVPVSIRMAKEQNLSLNPIKISGVCGRLMCCLKNEEETYEYLNSQLPSVGEYVTTDDGLRGEVTSVSVLRQLVKVVVQVDKNEKEIREYKVSQLKFRPRKRKDGSVPDGAEDPAKQTSGERVDSERDGQERHKGRHGDRNYDRDEERNHDSRDKGRDRGRERNFDRNRDNTREDRSKKAESGENTRDSAERNRDRNRRDREQQTPENVTVVSQSVPEAPNPESTVNETPSEGNA